MNAKSMIASWHSLPSIASGAANHGVAEPGLDLGLGQALRIRPDVEESERIRRAQLLVLLGERARIDELLDPLARANAEVVPAVRAHAKRLLELVVAVVGPAAGARVRVVGAWVGSSGRLLSTSTSTRPWPEDMRWSLVPG